MRLIRCAVITALLGEGIVARPQTAHAQVEQCTGSKTIQVAPYTCRANKVIDGITFDVTLVIEAAGRADVTFVMTPAQQVDVPIAVHSHTGVNGEPRRSVTAVIPAGFQNTRIVMSRVECGQLDIKAVATQLGAAAGRIAGPYVTWGQSCTLVEATTTIAPPTTGNGPTLTPPEATSIVSTPTSRGSLPVTGVAVPWLLVLTTLALAAVLILVSRLPHLDA